MVSSKERVAVNHRQQDRKATVIVKGRIAVKQKKKRETVITGKP